MVLDLLLGMMTVEYPELYELYHGKIYRGEDGSGVPQLSRLHAFVLFHGYEYTPFDHNSTDEDQFTRHNQSDSAVTNTIRSRGMLYNEFCSNLHGTSKKLEKRYSQVLLAREGEVEGNTGR